jgi:hypothetical protein
MRELERMLAENETPSELMEKTGRSREELQRLVESYKRQREQQERRDNGEPEPGDGPGGDVLDTAGRNGQESGVNLGGALPELSEADESDSTFQGAGEELSPRYRDLVNRYYKSVSEEQ